MRLVGRWANVLALALLFVALSHSWPWPAWDSSIDVFPLIRRADDSSTTTTSTSTSAATTAAAAASSSSSSSTGGSTTDSASTDTASTSGDSSTASGSTTAKSSTTTASNTTTTTSSTSVASTAATGGVDMIYPASTDDSQYYKVGDYVTFEWNYTSLSITPTAVDVLASCSLNSVTYTISSNMSVAATGKVVWDTGNTDTMSNPYPVATYTLMIFDAAIDATDVASAGHLEPYTDYTFGMYTGQPYTPLNEFKCVTCSDAWSVHEKQLLAVVGVTAVVTVLSFTWFANGFGTFR